MTEYKYKALKINGKRIDEHRHVMQLHLGRKLLTTEIVRHYDGNTRNNVIENMYVINKNEQIKDQIKKGEVSQQIKDALERKKAGIKKTKKKWHPKGWIPKATGRPRKFDSVNSNITSAVISRYNPNNPTIKKKVEKTYETKKPDTSKLVPLKIDRKTTIYIKEGTSQKDIDRIIHKHENRKLKI